MTIPRQTAQYDERRNTSRVWPVTPEDGANARRALEHLRRTDPALVRWIEDGHPTLTEAEHLRRFGEPYISRRKAKTTKRPGDAATSRGTTQED